MVYLQQDAFDPVDVSVSLERQQESFCLLQDLIRQDWRFADKDQARDVFTRLAGLYKNINYARRDSPDYDRYRCEIEDLAGSHAS